MGRRIPMLIALSGLAVMAFGAGSAGQAQGAQWYPFYGYHRPSYLDQPCVGVVQPSTGQASTAYYPPSDDSAMTQPTKQTQPCGGSPWYPFYGYNRPGYLDR